MSISTSIQNQPQLEITIDRDRAQELGVSAEEIGATLETMLGGVTDTTFMERGEEYDVFLRAKEEAFTSALDLASLYVRSHTSGSLIRLDNLVTIEEVGKAAMLKHYNRNRAITISASLEGNYAIGEALAYLDQQVVDLLPPEAIVNYKGESLDYRSNQSAIFFVFAMAMLVVYLVLAAQFESFVHPLIVMLTVPLGISGALFGLYISGETLNIFSQLAMIMLIGLSAKNGILIVEFINQLRDQGMAFNEAVVEASALRLRPDSDDCADHCGRCHSSAAGNGRWFRVPILNRGRRLCRGDCLKPVNAVCGAIHVCIDGQENLFTRSCDQKA